MNIPLKKILLWLVLLLVVLVVYATWKVHNTERQLESFLNTELAPTDTSAGISAGRVTVSVSRGQLQLSDITFYASRGEQVWHTRQLYVGIGTWKSLQLGILPAAFVLATVDETRIDVAEFTIGTHPTVNGTLKLFGSPFELFPILAENRFPRRSMRMEVMAGPVSSTLLDPLLAETPVSGWEFVADQIQLTASIDPSTGRVALNQLQLSGEGLPSVQASVTMFYPEDVLRPNLTGSLRSTARLEGGLQATLPAEGALSVIPIGSTGAIGFEAFAWQFVGDLDALRTEHPLRLHRHEISVQKPVLYPQPGALGQLENVLILFGIPTQSLPFESFRVVLLTDDIDQFDLQQVELRHVNFRASFDGSLKAPSLDRLLEETVDGTIRLDQMSPEVFNAVTSFEMILGWNLERDGDALLLPLRTGLGAAGR